MFDAQELLECLNQVHAQISWTPWYSVWIEICSLHMLWTQNNIISYSTRDMPHAFLISGDWKKKRLKQIQFKSSPSSLLLRS